MSHEYRTQSISKLDMDLFLRIQDFYFELRNCERGFPNGYCYTASSLVEKHFGLGRKVGTFTLDKPDSKYGYDFPHGWNFDADGAIIDLTASQFNDQLNEPLEQGIVVIYPNTPNYARFKQRDILSRL